MELAPAREPEPEAEPAAPASKPEDPLGELEAPPDTGIWTTESHQFEDLKPADAPTLEDLPVAEFDRGEAEPAEAEAEIEEPGSETGDAEKPRRRRRRSRRKKGDAPVAEGDAPAAEPTLVAEEDEDSTAELVKDWNIPSWNDLIASLYRPDR
jgi:hypothetical protein